jgi:hypothetical protein
MNLGGRVFLCEFCALSEPRERAVGGFDKALTHID